MSQVQRIARVGGRAFCLCLCAGYLLLPAKPALSAPAQAEQAKQAAPPTWKAKSTREMMAKRDGRVPGPDFTKRFSKTNMQIVMRDGARINLLPNLRGSLAVYRFERGSPG